MKTTLIHCDCCGSLIDPAFGDFAPSAVHISISCPSQNPMARIRGIGAASFQHASLKMEEVCVDCNRYLADAVTVAIETLRLPKES